MKRLDLTSAADALRAGAVIAVPTDTVYGIGAALEAGGVDDIFAIKQRPARLSLPVMIGALEVLDELGVVFEGAAAELARAFWPGALTIGVDVRPELAELVGGSTSVGFRCPDHELLRTLLQRVGAMAVTSANTHGQPPCTTADEVQRQLGATSLAGVLDAGHCDGVVSSVVVVASAGWRLVREGAVALDEVRAVLGSSPLTP